MNGLFSLQLVFSLILVMNLCLQHYWWNYRLKQYVMFIQLQASAITNPVKLISASYTGIYGNKTMLNNLIFASAETFFCLILPRKLSRSLVLQNYCWSLWKLPFCQLKKKEKLSSPSSVKQTLWKHRTFFSSVLNLMPQNAYSDWHST